MEYASVSEALNGTNNTKVMTPLRVHQVIGKINPSGGSSDYNSLDNKPKINGVELVGNKTASDLGITGSDKNYVYKQNIPSSVWTIIHNLDKYPSVTIVDSAGSVVMGDIEYVSTSTLRVTFSSEFAGAAYLN